MIEYTIGNILESNTQALVNTVNLEGFMGKGIAYQFKLKFPNNNDAYIAACKTKEIDIGKVFTHIENDHYIVNFPTKDKWRKKSKYEYIEKGMDSLVEEIEDKSIESISIPALGCGNGGLDWSKVKEIIVARIKKVTNDCDVTIFEPSKYYNATATKVPKLNASHLILLQCKERLDKFNKIRLQKTAFFVNVFSGKDYFPFTDYKFGPYSHAIEILSREIKEYQNFYNIDSKQAINNLYNSIVSSSVNEKLQFYDQPVAKACGFVNNITKDKELEIQATIVSIVKNNRNLLTEDIVHLFEEWPKEKSSRFSKEEILQSLNTLEQSGLLDKTLVGFDLHQLENTPNIC